jgi:YD repeat-containing protein
MIVAGIMLIASSMAHAGVNPRNGDFYISYKDASLSGQGHEIELTRTYNSKSTYIGWFGFGWGSPFETHLTVMPDRTAVIVENGSGANAYYQKTPSSAKRVAAGVVKIVTVAKSRDKLSAKAAKDLTNKLMANEEARLVAVAKFHIQAQLPPDTTLYARNGGFCSGTLQRTDTGYRRDNGCGSVDEFDLHGNLTRMSRNDGDDGYQISLRIENDHPVEITDFKGLSIKLEWNSDGHVKQLTASDGKIVTYQYDDNHNLTLSNVIGGNFFRYDYDRNHNLTRIGYIDKTSMNMTYDERGSATSVIETTGERTLYEYTAHAKDGNTYSVRIRQIAKDGSETSKKITFQDDNTVTGERSLKSYSVGDQRCDDVTELDTKGRIISKKSKSGDVMTYTYHPTQDKVVTVKLNNELRAKYQYSDAGDLTHAEDTEGLAVDLEYDDKKHISHLITTQQNGTHDELILNYDDQGHPVELKHPEFGTITVKYDDKGEISHVESSAGAVVALHVTEIFGNVLKLVNLAKF